MIKEFKITSLYNLFKGCIFRIPLLIFCLNIQAQSAADPLITQGYEKIKDRKYSDALLLFDQAVKADPVNPKTYASRAHSLMKLERYDEALKDIYKALSINSNYPDAYYVRGLIEITQKKYDLAIVDFNTAIDYNPSYNAAKAAKVNVYYLSGDLKKSESYVDDYIKETPNYGDYYFYKGKLLVSRQKYEEALVAFNKALEFVVDMDKFEIYLYRGDAKQNSNQLLTAKEDFDRAMLLDNNNASVYNGLGVVNYKLGNFDVAKLHFDQAIKILEASPDKYEGYHEIYYNRGMTQYKLNELSKACQNFHHSCQLGNSNACKMVILKCIK